jgi:hypothetical protein
LKDRRADSFNTLSMCFSAGASFGASALLLGVGIGAIKKAESPKMMAFASMPVLFAVQQFAEGVLWLTFLNPGLASWHESSIYFFLLFAQVIWPLWVPFALWLMEPDITRKKMLSYFMYLGGAFSIYLVYCLFAYEVSAVIDGGHIKYYLYFPNMELRRSLYFFVTLIPFFISGLRYMRLLGSVFLVALLISYFFFLGFVISVWCFFAAVLSALILFVIMQNKGSAGNIAPVLKI